MNQPLIVINHETDKAPAGNTLLKHPDNVNSGTWKRITVAHIQSGQSRRYADSIYESLICFEGGCRSTVKGFDLPYCTKPNEEFVKNVARVLVREFKDKPDNWASARLDSILCVEQNETYSIWKVRIVEAYTD